MDFLKKNYEKILLGVVLLGLLVAVGFMLVVISNEQQRLTDLTSTVLHPKVRPLTNLDSYITVSEAALQRIAAPAVIDLGPPNRLFNPMPWQKRDRLIPASKVGPDAIAVTNIAPLYLRLTLDKIEPSDTGVKYLIGIEKQAAATPALRGKKEAYCKLNDKNDTFQLIEVKGKPDDPDRLVLQLNDTGEKAMITKGDDGKYQTFSRVDGYIADLFYAVDRKPWAARRVNSQPPLSCNGEEYNIVAITQNEVVLSAKSNGKKWTLKRSTTL